jgi:peptidoglycan/xylan/chitin deacetylase (PgdA/CDA1 family)
VASPALYVVMYHYVRDLPHTPFPRLKGMLTSAFRQQLAALRSRYEMATLESALDFLRGEYTPSRPLCLLTFDDGLKEHYTDVTPILVDCRVQGLFFVITSCLQAYRVAPVHMNHFLMAALDFACYQRAFVQRLSEIAPHLHSSTEVDLTAAQHTYRWDTPEVASFKYLFNFVLERNIRDQVVKTLFAEYIADEQSFASTLYLNWDEGKHMQAAGMLIGGHSHQHKPLATLSDEELHWDLSTCQRLLTEHLQPQTYWPFCYPYGQKDSFNALTVTQLKQLGFTCAFSTEVDRNIPGTQVFAIRRFDCNDIPQA